MLSTRSQQKRHPCGSRETHHDSNKKKRSSEQSKDGDGNDVAKALNANTAKSSVEQDPSTSSESDSEQASEQSDEDSFDGLGVLYGKGNDALDLEAVQNNDDGRLVQNDDLMD